MGLFLSMSIIVVWLINTIQEKYWIALLEDQMFGECMMVYINYLESTLSLPKTDFGIGSLSIILFKSP